MGNLCGKEAEPRQKQQHEYSQDPSGAATHDSAVTLKDAAKRYLPSDAIGAALQSARHQLGKNMLDSFADTYIHSKLIGHGAFAKVMICTHRDSTEKRAVKTVQKNLEEPAKQRGGV